MGHEEPHAAVTRIDDALFDLESRPDAESAQALFDAVVDAHRLMRTERAIELDALAEALLAMVDAPHGLDASRLGPLINDVTEVLLLCPAANTRLGLHLRLAGSLCTAAAELGDAPTTALARILGAEVAVRSGEASPASELPTESPAAPAALARLRAWMSGSRVDWADALTASSRPESVLVCAAHLTSADARAAAVEAALQLDARSPWASLALTACDMGADDALASQVLERLALEPAERARWLFRTGRAPEARAIAESLTATPVFSKESFFAACSGDPATDVRDGAFLSGEAIAAASSGAVQLEAWARDPALAPVLGPVEDLRCSCGKLDGWRSFGRRCPRCGVEVHLAAVRAARVGHLVLRMPVPHPNAVGGGVSILSSLLGLPPADVRAIVAQDAHVVSGVFGPELRRGPHADGYYGLRNFLESLDLHTLRELLYNDLAAGARPRVQARLRARIDVVEAVLDAEPPLRAEYFLVSAVPVFHDEVLRDAYGQILSAQADATVGADPVGLGASLNRAVGALLEAGRRLSVGGAVGDGELRSEP